MHPDFVEGWNGSTRTPHIIQWDEYVKSGANGVKEGEKQPKPITKANATEGMIDEVGGWIHRTFIVVDGNHRITLLKAGGSSMGSHLRTGVGS